MKWDGCALGRESRLKMVLGIASKINAHFFWVVVKEDHAEIEGRGRTADEKVWKQWKWLHLGGMKISCLSSKQEQQVGKQVIFIPQ